MRAYEIATLKQLTAMSEQELQSTVVEPLLRLMGFSHVRDTSGPNDKGKDLIAVRIDFGKTRLYAIQIKLMRFSGKHNKTNALTNAIVQFRQIFSEPVLDPTTNEMRVPDRCIFITPFEINRSAMESALGQLRELERREILLVDGPLLVDQVLKYMPEIIRNMSVENKYRMRLSEYANRIPEISGIAPGLEMTLTDIYVDVSFEPDDETILQLAKTRLTGKGTVVKPVLKRRSEETAAFLSSWPGEEEYMWSPPRKTPRNTSRVKRLQGGLRAEAGEIKQKLRELGSDDRERSALRKRLQEIDDTRIVELNLYRLLEAGQHEAKNSLQELGAMVATGVSGAVRTKTVRAWVKLRSRLKALKSLSLVKDEWSTCLATESHKIPALQFPVLSLVDVKHPVLLVGGPGTGKTTILRRLARYVADSQTEQIPVLLYLVRMQSEYVTPAELVTYGMARLDDHGLSLKRDKFLNLLNEGRVLLLLDGLDELGAKAPEALKAIRAFSSQYPRCSLILTSRDTVAYQSWEDSFTIHTVPFHQEQLLAFIDKWFSAQPSSRNGLKKWLEENPSMRGLASTPLIAALLCSLYHVKSDMPSTEVELYDQRLDLLLGRWEQAKGIESLPAGERRRYALFLMELAYDAHEGTARSVEYSDSVKLAEEYFSAKFHGSAPTMVQDCIHRGILLHEINGQVSFGHLTYQEFMVGKWLCHHNPVLLIWENMTDPWWLKSIDYYASLKGDISALMKVPEGRRWTRPRRSRVAELLRLAPLTSARIRRRFG